MTGLLFISDERIQSSSRVRCIVKVNDNELSKGVRMKTGLLIGYVRWCFLMILSLWSSQQVVYMLICFCSALTETLWEVISVPESKAYRYVDTKGEQFVRYTRYKLCRIYPAGYRIDSSNPNPQAFWNCGCQLGNNISVTFFAFF